MCLHPPVQTRSKVLFKMLFLDSTETLYEGPLVSINTLDMSCRVCRQRLTVLLTETDRMCVPGRPIPRGCRAGDHALRPRTALGRPLGSGRPSQRVPLGSPSFSSSPWCGPEPGQLSTRDAFTFISFSKSSASLGKRKSNAN